MYVCMYVCVWVYIYIYFLFLETVFIILYAFIAMSFYVHMFVKRPIEQFVIDRVLYK